MSSRDRRLAETKYADQKSATERNREKAETKGRVPADAGGSVIDALKRFDPQNPVAIPRDRDSIERAAAYKASLPPLG